MTKINENKIHFYIVLVSLPLPQISL
jgi:hypothetical protein